MIIQTETEEITLPSNLDEIPIDRFVDYHTNFIGDKPQSLIDIEAEKQVELSPPQIEEHVIWYGKFLEYWAGKELDFSSIHKEVLKKAYGYLNTMLTYHYGYVADQVFEFKHKGKQFFIHKEDSNKLIPAVFEQKDLFASLEFKDYIDLLSLVEIAESEALSEIIGNVRAGKYGSLMWFLPYLARKKNEKAPLERVARNRWLHARYNFFKDVPTQLVMNVSFFLFASMWKQVSDIRLKKITQAILKKEEGKKN